MLLHQLIMTLGLGLLKLQTDKQTFLSSCFVVVTEIVPANTHFSSSAHPFYVLDDFVDVGLIDLNLLPGNKQMGRV